MLNGLFAVYKIVNSFFDWYSWSPPSLFLEVGIVAVKILWIAWSDEFLVYDGRGQLKASRVSPGLAHSGAYPTDQYVGKASILWAPFLNPFWAWAIGAVGVITLRILDKRA